jgi:membrane protease YdiL (CAAX protease family)
MSTEPVIPPRPDGLHPAPPAPPTPARPSAADGRPLATWSWFEAVGIYLMAFLAAGLATVPVLGAAGEESDLANIVATVIAAVTIVAILLLWLMKAHRGWPAIVRMPARGRWRSDAGAGALFGIGLYPVAVLVVGGIVVVVLQALTGESVQAPEQVPQDLSPIGLLITIVYAVAIAPFGEELFFRGILFRALRDRFGFAVGSAGSAIAFGLIHYIPGPLIDAALLMLVMTFVGAALAFIYERRGAFVAPFAAHVTFNVIGLALILGLR